MDSGRRVLVVEGDDSVAAAIGRLVAEVGPDTEVVRAASVGDALSVADAGPRLDAAIVADELPDGSGLRVAQWTLHNPDAPPVLLLVTDEGAEVWESATRAGVTVILPRHGLTAQRLLGGLNLARDRSLSDRVGHLVTDAATGLDATDRLDHDVGALLVELLSATGADGVRLSVGVLSSRTQRWVRGDVDQTDAAALSVAGRTAGAVALLELFDHGGRSWTAVRPALTAFCEVVTAALLRRESVERVRTSEARLRDLAENVPDPIVSVDAQGRIAAANRRFSQAVGREDAVGQVLTELARPGSLAALAARAVQECRLTGAPAPLRDHPVEVPGAGQRWHEAKATPDDAGTVHVVLPDTTERVRSERRLTELALTDHLTGLANRRLAIDRLQHALDQVGRGQQHLVVSMCDIDHFKSTNDLFGHAAGDAILVALADRLRSAIRNADTAARLGGDEFLIISEAIDSPEAADVVIQRLHDRLCGPVEAGGEELHLSVSLGYVVVSDPGRSADDILRQADLALYAAKAGGRGRCAAYGVQAAASEAGASVELERAWRSGRFVPRWAPVTALDGSVVAARAVLAWMEEDGTERHPNELVAALSNGPLFSRVRRSLTDEVLRQRAEWRAAGLVGDDFAVHVRVFARQLADPELSSDILAELEATGTPPRALVLDVEDQAVSSSPGAVERLEELAGSGVRIHLDRVGAGPVRLERLIWPALSGLRLDPCLVEDVWRQPRRAAVVDCLLELGARSGLDVVVDGIDHPEQVEWLASRGSVAVSGPLVGEAMAATEMQDRLASAGPLERHRTFWLS